MARVSYPAAMATCDGCGQTISPPRRRFCCIQCQWRSNKAAERAKRKGIDPAEVAAMRELRADVRLAREHYRPSRPTIGDGGPGNAEALVCSDGAGESRPCPGHAKS
jgi:hypothetical protein